MFFIESRLDSVKTASWSDMPGITWTWLMSVVLLVNNRSKVVQLVSVILVGSVTT